MLIRNSIPYKAKRSVIALFHKCPQAHWVAVRSSLPTTIQENKAGPTIAPKLEEKERAEHPDRVEKIDKDARDERPGRTQKLKRLERPEKVARITKPERIERPERRGR